MATYLLTWNPHRWQWKNLAEKSDSVRKGEDKADSWSCGNTKKIVNGDRFFLFKQGTELPKGIFASGYVINSPEESLHWDFEKAKEGLRALQVAINFDILLNPYFDEILERDFLIRDNVFSRVNWNTQSSGIEILPDIAMELEEVWQNFTKTQKIYLPEEIEERDLAKIFEGAKKTIQINSYERNPNARKKCIEKYGTKCSVCDFDFNKFYGEEIAQCYIHVHHLKPLHEIDEEYEVNPIEDLRPVCPNCHAMLHRKNPPYSIGELKEFIENQTR